MVKKHGFLLIGFKYLFEKLKYLSLVELFKFIAKKINKNNINDTAYGRWAVDIFIILKWMFVIIIWSLHIQNSFLTFFIWYLIATNLYSYFYYHIWCDDALNTENFERDRIRRRFLNLMLAVSFSILCFAYLYQLPYSKNFQWPFNIPCSQYAILFSFSNSLAGNYEGVTPLNDFGNLISNIELFISFTFVTLILSRSIPQTNSNI